MCTLLWDPAERGYKSLNAIANVFSVLGSIPMSLQVRHNWIYIGLNTHPGLIVCIGVVSWNSADVEVSERGRTKYSPWSDCLDRSDELMCEWEGWTKYSPWSDYLERSGKLMWKWVRRAGLNTHPDLIVWIGVMSGCVSERGRTKYSPWSDCLDRLWWSAHMEESERERT